MNFPGLYWSEDFDLKTIKTQLRIWGKGYTAPKIVDAWQTGPQGIGVPRQWARLRGWPSHGVCPKRAWPKFKGGYWYNQQEVCSILETALREKHGALMESPTGWGKTVAALNIASRFNTNVLVLVHKQDLIPHWQKSATDLFGIQSGIVQQDKWEYEHPLTIGMIQTLDARGLPKDFQDKFGFVIVDEGHHVPCETFANVISQLPARYRLGVSATWRRTDGLENLWNWHIGEIEAKGVRPIIPAKYFQMPVDSFLKDGKFMRNGEINHSALITAISEDTYVNEQVVTEATEALQKGRNVLIVTHRVPQVEYLAEVFPDAGVYTGKYKGKVLKDAQLQESSKKQLILATYGKISEGTDIPRLDTLILATPCSDPEQVYGRVARESPGKKNIVVVDIFPSTGYNYALARKREKVYQRLKIQKG